MPRKRRHKKKERIVSPKQYAEAYGSLLQGGQEKRTTGIKEPLYVRFARFAGRIIRAPNKFQKIEYQAALDFLGWDLEPRDVNAAGSLALVLSLLAVVPAAGILLYMTFVTYELSYTMLFYTLGPLVLVPFLVSFYVQNYILFAAKKERMLATSSISDVVNYLTMSMKLSPNLERAISFAAEHATGKIAEELKQLDWEIRTGVHASAEEALDKLAYKWGAYSDEFKHALMLIRSSTIEVDEAKRSLILDKAVSDTLEGIKENMNAYAGEMRQPSIYLYYMGVLLPLLLIILLPIGSIMARLPFSRTPFIILFYNILVPLAVFVFARNIIGKRPPVYTAPEIPDDFPGLPKKGRIRIGKSEVPAVLLGLVAALAIIGLFSLFLDPVLNPYPPEWNVQARENWYPLFSLTGVFLGGAVFSSIVLYSLSHAKRKAQKEIMGMENEFQDSVYLLASRLGENRPVEEAVEYTASFLGDTPLGRFYQRTADNIRNLGMTLDAAFFDPVYGSLKTVPSRLIRGAVRVMVDAMSLGVQQAARALISLSLQIRDSQKVRERIVGILKEITGMMRSIVLFIGPIVLGITTSLQGIVVSTLKRVSETGLAGGTASIPGVNLPMVSFGSPEALAGTPGPMLFMIIMAVFMVELTVLLVYFITRVEEGENNTVLYHELAKTLPIALALFFLSAWFSQSLTGAVI